MGWQDAVEVDGDGCALLVEVTAGAREPQFPAGYNEWRGRILMRVHAPARAGQANREVVAAVAHAFNVPPSRVQIEAGGSDSRKRVAVAGLDRQAAVARLADLMPETR
jgi:hypothetical protein